jgi:hypothetical protein
VRRVRIKVFTNGGKNPMLAELDANDWLERMGDSIEVVSIDTTASAVSSDGITSEMLYVTITYREYKEVE